MAQVLAPQASVLALPPLQVFLHVLNPRLHAGGRVLGLGSHGFGTSNLLACLICGRQRIEKFRGAQSRSTPDLP